MKVIQIHRLHISFCQGDDNVSDWNQLNTECPKNLSLVLSSLQLVKETIFWDTMYKVLSH